VADDRCERTDLIVDQCACAHHRGGRTPQEEVDAERSRVRALLLADSDSRWFAAMFAGSCGRCGERFPVGAAIRMRLDWDSTVAPDTKWVAECCPREVNR
jgi:hypothetical protein